MNSRTKLGRRLLFPVFRIANDVPAAIRRPVVAVCARVAPNIWQDYRTIWRWKEKEAQESGRLLNTHYEPFYTTVFGLTHADYAGKAVLDIGCGPRGSLEWA